MSFIKSDAPSTERPVASTFDIVSTVVLSVLVLYVSAKIHVPFYPVPLSLQTMAVMGLALATGPRNALISYACYIALGVVGFPVLADSPARGVGLSYMMGPTGGYLIGMFLACGFIGSFGGGRGPIGRVLAMLGGMVIVYAFGVLWLEQFVGSFEKAFLVGALRFFPGDLLKIALITAGAAVYDLMSAPRRFSR